MLKALPTFEATVINAEVYYDFESKYLKASIIGDTGDEYFVNVCPDRLLEIYTPDFVRYMRFGVRCPALLVRAKNPSYIEEAPEEAPEYLYKVVSYNDTKAEIQYQSIVARQDGEAEGYDMGYEEGYTLGFIKGKYYGAKQLGDHLKDFMPYTEVTEQKVTIEINNIVSDLYDDVINKYPNAFAED